MDSGGESGLMMDWWHSIPIIQISGYYVITRNLWTYRLKIDNAVYSPVFNDVNGFIYWKDNSNFFYYSKAYGWILHNRFPGYEPKENYNSESKEYEGDAFHAGSVPSARDGGYSYLQPRGTNRNGGGANKTVYFDFPPLAERLSSAAWRI